MPTSGRAVSPLTEPGSTISDSASFKKPPDNPLYLRLDANKLHVALGRYGLYQVLCYSLCQFLEFFYAGPILVMTIIQDIPAFTCQNLTQGMNVVSPKDQCALEIGKGTSHQHLVCGDIDGTFFSFNDSSEQDVTMLHEFNLLCRSPFIQQLAHIIYFLGAMLVVPIASQLSDLYGRRYILFGSVFLSVLLNIGAAFAPNYATFIALRFFIGASSDSFMTISPILSCELVTGDLRDWFGLFSTFAWAGGYAYVGVLSIFIKQWRTLYFAVGVPGLVTVFFPLIIPESPYWMLAHGNWKGVQRYIERSERMNKVKVDLKDCQVDLATAYKVQRIQRRTFIDAFKSKPMMFMILVNGFITMGLCFYYFAICFDSRKLTADKATGYLLSALVELPGGLLTIPLLRHFGRRTITIWAIALQGIVICFPPFLRSFPIAYLASALVCKVINAIALISHPLLVNELMPTTLRAVSMAVINIPESIGTMISPLLQYTDIGDGTIPAFILAGLSAVAALFALTLSETKGKDMPEDFEQLDPGPFFNRFIDSSSSSSSSSTNSSTTATTASPHPNVRVDKS